MEPGSKTSTFVKVNRLRPEFLLRYDSKINPDILLELGNIKQLQQTDNELYTANKVLNLKNIKNLVRSLDMMDHIPIDSDGINKVFHDHGVSVRYIG